MPITLAAYVEYLVQVKQVDQAKTAIEAARKALSADRAGLALVQCYAMVGEVKQADEMVQAALESPACDPATIRAAVDLSMSHGRFDQVESVLVKLSEPSMGATQDDLAWANRTRGQVLSTTGRLADLEAGLALLEKNLENDPSSIPDQKLKAVLLAMRTSGRGEAAKILEGLDSSKQLGTFEQFILAQLFRGERLDEKYRNLMLKILDSKARNPNHLSHFISFLIDRDELDQADQRLAELRQVEPRGLRALELEARLLKARYRDSELHTLLEARGRAAPDQIGNVAVLLDRYGFTKQAEDAYRAYIARNPKEPERTLVLAPFLARANRLEEAVEVLKKAWKTCRPEAVATTALALYDVPSADGVLEHQVEAWLSEAIQKSPSAAPFLQPKLANIYWKQGRSDQSEALLRQVLASDPDNVEALNSLAWELALRDPGKANEAVELVNRAIEKVGASSALVDTRPSR